MKKETTPSTIEEKEEIIDSALPSPSEPKDSTPQNTEEATEPVDKDATPVVNEDAAPENPAPDLQALLAEAEQKGYLRGRNERIEELMREPQTFERQSSPERDQSPGFQEGERTSEPLILNNPRISIWDR